MPCPRVRPYLPSHSVTCAYPGCEWRSHNSTPESMRAYIDHIVTAHLPETEPRGGEPMQLGDIMAEAKRRAECTGRPQ